MIHYAEIAQLPPRICCSAILEGSAPRPADVPVDRDP